jgi:hypothetical protein
MRILCITLLLTGQLLQTVSESCSKRLKGRRRLFHKGDPYHPERDGSKTMPKAGDLPPRYRKLLAWFEGWSDEKLQDAIKNDPLLKLQAMAYARLRADRSLRPPDTIELACAASAGVDLFITNDARLHSKQIPGIQFIVPLDRAPI